MVDAEGIMETVPDKNRARWRLADDIFQWNNIWWNRIAVRWHNDTFDNGTVDIKSRPTEKNNHQRNQAFGLRGGEKEKRNEREGKRQQMGAVGATEGLRNACGG